MGIQHKKKREICSLIFAGALFLTLQPGFNVRPHAKLAGIRTALDLIDKKGGTRQALMLNGLKSVSRSK